MENKKTCTECGKPKLKSEFYTQRNVCKKCTVSRNKTYNKIYVKRDYVVASRAEYAAEYNKRDYVKARQRAYRTEYNKRMKLTTDESHVPQVEKKSVTSATYASHNRSKWIENGRLCKECGKNTQGNWFWCPSCHGIVTRKG